MHAHAQLDAEQTGLLCTLVEVIRSVPQRLRMKFSFVTELGPDPRGVIDHPGLEGGKPALRAHMSDLEVLQRAGLLSLSFEQGLPNFYILPEGFQFYERLKQNTTEVEVRGTEVLRRYLNSDAFRGEHAGAYAFWSTAEDLLWRSDSAQQLTSIGHSCREAMQAFASSLLSRHKVPPPDANPANVVKRIRAVLEATAGRSDAVEAFLQALLAYWGCVSDLAQRQEHGSKKEGEPLSWEDARRLVFHTLVVMCELDRNLAHS